MHIVLLSVYILALIVMTWRGSWFEATCGAILLMAFMQHPDMPKNIAGIQGLNPWNILILNIVLSWVMYRSAEGRIWDLPAYVTKLLVVYLLVILVGFVRLCLDSGSYDHFSIGYIFGEFFINTYKWIIPGMLLYDGCRTRGRICAGLVVITLFFFLLAVQVIRVMPLENVVSGDALQDRAGSVLSQEVGFHRVNLSMMLSGASWATLALVLLLRKKRWKLVLLGMAGSMALGQALTGGRMGYVTWGVVGVVLCLVRWRKLLPIIPLAVIVVITFIPAVKERMLFGISHDKYGAALSQADTYSMTSGRALIWPFVIEAIKQNPILGYGRQAMVRIGLATRLLDELGESFPHPHNAYLELLLDNGIIGFLGVIPFYLTILFHSISLLADRNSSLAAAVGGYSAALILALLVASFGAQTFYPREGAVGLWAAIGIMLRVHLERSRADSAETAFPQTLDEQHLSAARLS
jgi:O-antigen ligase